jgi:GT2 family glycosyltransferase
MKTQPVMVSVIIPVYNSADALRRCLEAVATSTYTHYECIVVDDGSTDDSRDVAASFSTRLVALSGEPRGPAYARNRGAEVARGDVVFFVDADVVMACDTLMKLAETFAADPTIGAVFGSYDDNPEARDFLSRYKNLFHHFVHQHARQDAVTFWSGCGAVRRPVFLELGGFDEVRYPRPSIEDIDLGYRLRAAGHRIVLNKAMQVQHLKRWTMRSMIKTDIVDRGIPWTQLVLREKHIPNDLNLRFSQRVSAFLLYAVLVYLGLIAFFHDVVILPLLVGLFLLVAGNWSEGTPHFQMSRRAQALTYFLIAAIAALAWRSGQTRMFPLLGLLVLGLLADRAIPHSGWRLKRAVFATVVLGLLVSVFMMLSNFSIRLGAPLLLFVLLIVAINNRFYRFFARKCGFIFMLAVIPFHLLYYLYSIAAFALGVGIYLFGDPRRTQHGSVPSAGRSGPPPLRPSSTPIVELPAGPMKAVPGQPTTL